MRCFSAFLNSDGNCLTNLLEASLQEYRTLLSIAETGVLEEVLTTWMGSWFKGDRVQAEPDMIV